MVRTHFFVAVGVTALSICLSEEPPGPKHGASDPEIDLPDVDTVMEEAVVSQAEIAAKIAAMRKTVAEDQKENVESLASKRIFYEKKLAEQADRNREITSENERIRQGANNLQHGTEAILTEIRRMRGSNRLLRSALQSLEPKMEFAFGFLNKTTHLRNSSGEDDDILKAPPDPSFAHFLDVMQHEAPSGSVPPASNPVGTASHAENATLPKAKVSLRAGAAGVVAAPDDGEQRVSLLAIESSGPGKKVYQKAEDLVPVLTNGLQSLYQTQEEAETRLKAHYLALFEAGQKKEDHLLEVQSAVRDRFESLQLRQNELHTAKARVNRTRSELKQRIEALRLFVQKSGSTVAAALAKARGAAGSS